MSLALFQTVTSQSYLFDKRDIRWNQTIQEKKKNKNDPESDRGTQLQALRRAGKSEASVGGPREAPLEVVSLVPAPMR